MSFRKQLQLESMSGENDATLDSDVLDTEGEGAVEGAGEQSVGSVDDVIVESSGPLSVEVINERGVINSEIAGEQETVDTCDAVSEEIRLTEKILDSLDEAETISDAHAQSLQLITERFETKWGYRSRTLTVESFQSEDRTLTREGFVDYLKYLGAAVAINVAVFAIATALAASLLVTLEYLATKITPYRQQLDGLLRQLSTREPSEVAISVRAADTMPSKWGWVRKLHLGGEFMPADYNKFLAAVDEAGKGESLLEFIEYKSESKNPAEFAGKVFEVFADMIGKGVVPLWGAREATVGVEEIQSTKVIGAVTVSKVKIGDNIDAPEMTHSQLVEVITKAKAIIDRYAAAKGKLSEAGKALKAATKEAKGSKPVTEDDGEQKGLTDAEAADLKRAYTSTGILIKEVYVNSLTDLIEGIIGYADASVNVKAVKLGYMH